MLGAAHPASFRDPAGYIFEHGGSLYRAIASSGYEDYQMAQTSGLHQELIDAGWLVPHEDTDITPPDGYRLVIKPEKLPFISYPYEWSFGQLKEAALLTLHIQSKALAYGMILKDASAYNVAWHGGRPVFLDTLSFAKLQPGQPWHAYGQFCSHFLAPLTLMSCRDIRLQKLLQSNIDGIALDLAADLLPKRTKLKLNYLIHLHLHAKARKKYAGTQKKVAPQISDTARKNLTQSLISFISSLKSPEVATEWADYYNDTNYSPEQFAEKKSIIAGWLQQIKPAMAYDLGANDGTFSRLAAQAASVVIAADIDPMAVEFNYRQAKQNKEKNIIPLLQDLTQPSPALGWDLKERDSFLQRARPDLGLALALVHHLAIGNNTPLTCIIDFFAEIAPVWIIEFPDKQDSQVQRLLLNREDIFPHYDITHFENLLWQRFIIKTKRQIRDSFRTLYWVSRKQP